MSLRKALWELNSFLPGEVPGSLNPQMLKVAIDHLDSITAAIPLVIDRLANELEELANNGKLKCTEQDSDLRMELLRLQAQLLADAPVLEIAARDRALRRFVPLR